jgi:uncharacterized membrane protein
MTPAELSRQLREDQSPAMRRRRWIVGLSLLGVGIGQVVAAFQTGLIKRLPDPPIGPFDSARVDASDYAYKRGGTPDALFMIITYGITAALAGAGGKNRARTEPWLPIALAGKAAYDAATCVKLGMEEWEENKALCAYCQAATLISFATLGLSLFEAAEAARNLERRAEPATRRAAQAVRRRAVGWRLGERGGRSLEDLARRVY